MFAKFYRKLFVFIAIFSMIVFISGSLVIAKKNKPKGAMWDVYPSMNRGEIQGFVDAALDGDTIYFHAGTYDWSDASPTERGDNQGAINIIDKSLIIKGEQDTIIVGPNSTGGTEDHPIGVNAFYIQNLDITNDVTFDGLEFHNFLRGIDVGHITHVIGDDYYIAWPNVKNITVKNCKFLDIHRDAVSLSNLGGNILIHNNNIISADRYGMFISWYWAEPRPYWQPDDSYVQILRNKINSARIGVFIADSTNVFVEQNTIVNCERWGIYNDGARKGTFIISNSIFNCRDGIMIWGGWYEGKKYEAEGAVIEKNKLYDITDGGIDIVGNECFGHTVSKNKIHMAPISATGIYSEGHDNYFGQNKISGSGWIAFCLGYDGSSIIPYNETLQANNVNQFSPTKYWHFYLHFGTHDNLIIGSGMGHNTYVDNGYNNRITGVTPMAGGIGQDLSEAIKKRNEELKEGRKIKF